MDDRFKGYRRSSPRLGTWDYSATGCYFVTICTGGRVPWFGRLTASGVDLSRAGAIARERALALPGRFDGLDLEAWVVMPDHVHLLLGLKMRETTAEHPPGVHRRFGPLITGSLSSVVNHYKGGVTRAVRGLGHREFRWQRLYHDRIVRNDRERAAIHEYIRINETRPNPP